METNGDFKKYFDALNKRLDANFEAIDKRFGSIESRLDRVESRLDRVESRLDGVEDRLGRVEDRVGSIEERLVGQGQSILSMQDSLAVVIKAVTLLSTQFKKLEKRVERIEIGQTTLVKMIADIRGLESGKTLELKDVHYSGASQTLSGTIREKPKKYGKGKRKGLGA